MNKLIILLIFVGLIASAFASEVDSFTRREELLRDLADPSEIINTKINEYIQISIEKANDKSKKCNIKRLHKFTKNFLGGHFRIFLGPRYMKYNNLYRFVKYPKKYKTGIQIEHIDVEDSIFQDFGAIEAPSLAMVSKFHDTMASIMKIDNLIIGTDKISGHFFQRGFFYFEDHYGLSSKGKKLLTQQAREKFALDTMIHSEQSLYGAKSTGIASFADLAANFQGFRFWIKLTAMGEDIITGKVPAPYISCVDNKWVQNEQVNMLDYLDAAWDEGLNCSKFQKEKMGKAVYKRVTELPDYKVGFHCPLNINRLRKTKARYGKYYDRLINETPYLKLTKGKLSGWKTPKVKKYVDTKELAERKKRKEK